MKRIYILFLFLVFTSTLHSQNAIITVVAPNGGENWTIGCPYAIQWITAAPMSVKIELYKNGAFCQTICSQVPAGMSTYTWIPSYALAPANTYKVKISSLTSSAGYDFSNNNFTISPGSITVISPNGGEVWQKGTTHLITWTDNVCENVRIELWKGGVYNSLITASTPSTGSYYWAIPNNNTLVNGNDYKIKIMVPLNSGTATTVYDFSNANFTIGSQCLILLVPNGGEVWYGGGTYVISWIDCIAENVRIELWKGGVYNSLICNSTTGPYSWTIPAAIVAGNDYKVKIIGGTSSTANYDFSDANFTINQGPYIIVTSPNGGEVWARGTTHIITWLDNIPQDVRVELWKGGVYNSLISAQTPSNGSCYWAIPATIPAGNDYKVKVMALSNSATNTVFDFSDNNFTILASNITHNTMKSASADVNGNEIKIYPNPCSDLLHVALADGSSTPCDIDVIDLTGKTVLHQDVPEGTSSIMDIKMTNLGEGYYILIIRKDHEMIFKKGVVIRH
ncbi:MAG: hypothetical protein NTU98_10050 [Bacteroidetes bacterium]|nr:hypothetical protein [Bacteroidota bacterium]